MLTRIQDPDLYRLANKTQAITTSAVSSEMAEGVGAGINVVMINATADAYIDFGGEVDLVEWSEVTTAWSAQTNTWKQFQPVGEGYVEKGLAHLLENSAGTKGSCYASICCWNSVCYGDD